MVVDPWPLSLYLATGVSLGLAGGLAPGPLTTLVLSQTLRFGPREGIMVALVPVLTDGPLVFLSAWAVGTLAESPQVLGAISMVGAAFLLFLAVDTWRAGSRNLEEGADEAPGSLRRGIITNLLNPHPYLFWGVVGGPTVARGYQDGPLSLVGFLGAFFLCLVGAKVLLATLAGHYRQRLLGKPYRGVMAILGVSLAGFALVFVRDGAKLLGWW